MTGWDNTPRLPANGHVFVNAHPANYQRWLTAVVAQTVQRNLPGERLVFINAWNEWAEGSHLEPDEAYGHAYLEATRRALRCNGRGLRSAESRAPRVDHRSAGHGDAVRGGDSEDIR